MKRLRPRIFVHGMSGFGRGTLLARLRPQMALLLTRLRPAVIIAPPVTIWLAGLSKQYTCNNIMGSAVSAAETIH